MVFVQEAIKLRAVPQRAQLEPNVDRIETAADSAKRQPLTLSTFEQRYS
jgi:hypothetical protein